MPKRKQDPDEAKQQAVEEIAGLVDAFCREHLNEDYADLCRRLTEKLARRRPAPLVSGRPKTWACGIVLQAFFEFEENGTGHFQFGDVSGYMDWRATEWDSEPTVEWPWEGGDGADGTPLTGRGWSKLKDAELHRMIFIQLADDLGFVAKKSKGKPQKKSRR